MNDLEEKKLGEEEPTTEIGQSKFAMRSSSFSKRYYSSGNFSIEMIPMSNYTFHL
jgi:hypothetical protein